jgi:hypothetical protein
VPAANPSIRGGEPRKIRTSAAGSKKSAKNPFKIKSVEKGKAFRAIFAPAPELCGANFYQTCIINVTGWPFAALPSAPRALRRWRLDAGYANQLIGLRSCCGEMFDP